MDGWIGSPGHYKNLVDNVINYTGIAVVVYNNGST